MNGTRHPSALLSGRTLLVSVLALLAFALLPALARADSSGAQYSDAPPTVTGAKVPKNHEPPAKTSTADNGGGSSKQNTGGSDKSHSSENGSQGASSPGSGGGPGSSGGGGAEPGGQGKPGGQGSVPPGSSTGSSFTPASTKSAGGGSSPLVPILIAIAALAAISLGVVTWQRRRRGAGGASVSPKAG
jgi:cobalamin biosynthesis Mg chelatase CobN